MSKPSRSKPVKLSVGQYRHVTVLQTRWSDNDVYGHVNNAVYYHYFDTLVNNWLISKGLLEIGKSDVIGLVVNTQCDFFAPIAYPQMITAGLATDHIGTSSVTYRIGLFTDEGATPCAQGTFTHVYVDAKTRKPIAITDDMRKALETLQ